MIRANGTIGFELEPLEDELLYGWLARHRAFLHLSTSLGLLRVFLGSRLWNGSPMLPIGLRGLADRLPSGRHDQRQLIADHTGYPYFASFATMRQRNGLAAAIGEGWGRRGRSFWMTWVSQHSKLLYCRACRMNQLRKTGQATWNRIHQVPGVFRCHEHDEPLMASCIPADDWRVLHCCPVDDQGSTLVDNPLHLETARRVARLTAYFMHHPRVASRVQLSVGVFRFLRAAAWLHESGRVRRHLWPAFEKHVGFETLERLGCGRIPRDTSWIQDIVGAHVVGHHPLRYLLLFDFLGLDPADLNGFPPGESEINSEDRAGVAALPRVDLQEPSTKLLAVHRQGILADAHAGLSRAEIQRKYPRRFRSMMAFDRDWLNLHVPHSTPARPERKAADVEEDARLAHAISAAISRLSTFGEARPVWITVASIAAEAGLTAYRTRLPQTLRLLESASETVAQHRVRVLRWTAERYCSEGGHPSFTEFAKRAAFKPERFPALRESAHRIHESIASQACSSASRSSSAS